MRYMSEVLLRLVVITVNNGGTFSVMAETLSRTILIIFV